MTRPDRRPPPPGEAMLEYLDGDFRVVRAGNFVTCAVTGVRITLEELKYWSVALQEAYATPEAVMARINKA
jgi:hypothetical protein